jgi:hypothetical protein
MMVIMDWETGVLLHWDGTGRDQTGMAEDF